MRDFWRLLSQPVYIPFVDKVEDTYRAFSPSGRALFLFFSTTLIISSVGLVYFLNQSFLTNVPAYGGEITEGIIGSPRFINPVLAISDADRDVSSLVYSGLLKADAHGDYVTDLASSFTVSKDGRTYTVLLRRDATFQDGSPVTADDVLYTISKVQDPAIKSPLAASWSGVTVTEIDPYTLQFSLKEQYAPFIENLTMGIIPKHLWQSVADEEFPFSELNSSPVGSGPYRISSITRTPSGIPASYDLVPFSKYALGEAYLSHLYLKFYQSEDAVAAALKAGQIDAASGLSPKLIIGIPGNTIERSPLNRVFGVFFNQNQSEVLRDPDVRHALEDAIDRDALVEQVLDGYGTPLDGPVPPSVLGLPASSSTGDVPAGEDRVVYAQTELIKKGWQLNNGVLEKTTGKGASAKTVQLSFSLSTGNVPELKAAAEYVQQQWQAMGAQVDVKVFDQGDLSQNVIRPRKYDALLFGEVIGRELDLYAFWNSSQRNDPGLNIAMYANSTVDKILEQLRGTSDDTLRQSLYQKFDAELKRDVPAVFLYAPDFVYSVPNDLKGLDLGFIETPSDRFSSVAQWHRETDNVWPLFVKK